MNNKIFYYLLAGAICCCITATLTSCSDFFEIKPASELVEEDFWQSKNDVESSVMACYRALEEPDAMERFIVWGEVRSDNVVRGVSPNDNISYILSANIDAQNSYTSWASIYQAINNCNTVIQKAPAVCQHDPNFKQSELRAFIAEVKTLRALCYFYLVRTFRDVPFITEPYTDDTRQFQAPQTSGDAIIDSLLLDLESIQNQAKAEYATTADTRGRITQKALWTLMADMYLWRNDYDGAIELCDRVLRTTTNPLSLVSANNYNRQVFGIGNSSESIFELQFDHDTPDYVVNEMYSYWQSGGRSFSNHLAAADFNDYRIFQSSDVRSKDACYRSGTSALIPIMKYIAYRRESNSQNVQMSDYVANENTQHWIFYRLSDVYLMKAEALTERNQPGDLSEALELVSRTYDRANPSAGVGSLDASRYSSQEQMRQLVFDERQREFLFEGKRYFDLLRKIRREGNLQSIVSEYLLRKYVSQDQATVLTKINTMNALYMPINRDELKVNKLLRQNPFYATSSDVERN